MTPNKIHAIRTAQEWLSQRPLYLDTETTGLGSKDQVIELALIDSDGKALINTFIQPTVEINPKTTEIHGITMNDVAGVPLFINVLPTLAKLVKGRLVLIYNADFDLRLLKQSATAHKTALPPLEARCVMRAYAQFYGEKQSLGNAAFNCGFVGCDLHRSAVDAELCRRIVETMAEEVGEVAT